MTIHTTMIAPPAMQEIDVNLVQAGDRLRAVDEAQVEALKDSIADIGLLNPITVYRRSTTRDGVAIEGFGVIAGAHRLAAYLSLGYATIPAVILDMDELHRTIAECDENLCGPRLSQAERALFTKRRKEAYEQLHPETKHGGDRRSDQVANLATRSFADETAAATGKSARAVRRDAERGVSIPDHVFEMVMGTKLTTGVYLDQLKELSPSEQEQRVRADLEALEDEKAGAASARAAFKRNTGKKSKKSKDPHHCANLTADRPKYFVWLLDELAGFRRAEFEEWLTMDRKQTLEHAHTYAKSAMAMVGRFLEIHSKPKA